MCFSGTVGGRIIAHLVEMPRMSAQPEWLRLEEGEELVWTGEPRLRSILGTVAGALVSTVVALAVIGVLLTSDRLPVQIPVPDVFLLGAAVLVVLYGAAKIGWAYVRISNVSYVLTSTSLYKKTGVFSESTTRIRVNKIQNTQLSKDLLGNLFDYGDVLISTAGGSGIEMAITELNDPNEFRDLLRRQIRTVEGEGEGRSSRPHPAGALDPETGERLAEEARALRESARRLEEVVTE